MVPKCSRDEQDWLREGSWLEVVSPPGTGAASGKEPTCRRCQRFGSPWCQEDTSLVAQRIKSLPAMRETRVRSLGWESLPGGGLGNPLQYSSLESPIDRGAWRAIVHGFAGLDKSRTGWGCESLDFTGEKNFLD